MNAGIVSTPSISMITICRNSAATIAKTIESVLVQKEADVEYIVVDGLSTDGTQTIVRSFQAVDRFISEPDQGIADAFNKGIHLAAGDIIGLINSDDQLCPGALSSVRRYFAEHPDVDVVHGDVLLCRGERVLKRVRPAGRWWYPWRLVLFNHPATFVRKRVYEQHGLFDISYQIAMDVEIYLRWQVHGVRIKYLPEVFVNMESGGLSGLCADEGFRESRKALLKYGYSGFLASVQFAGRQFINRVLSWRTGKLNGNVTDRKV